MSLSTIVNELAKKKHEAEILIQTVKEREVVSGNAQLCSILKSSIVLVLYNAIESTLYDSLEALHDECIDKSFNELTYSQKEIFIQMNFKKLRIKEYIKKIECIIESSLKFPTFKEFRLENNLFSGNVDAKKIDTILAKYGINHSVKKTYRNSFLYVKNLRNKLAHGESSFSGGCRDILISEISKTKSDIFSALSDITTNINIHIKTLSNP